MNRKSILALLFLSGGFVGPVLVAAAQPAQEDLLAEYEQNNSQANEYYASLPHGDCDLSAGNVDLRTPVFTEAVQQNDPDLGPDVWVAWGLLVNGDAEVTMFRIASGDLARVQELAGSVAAGLPVTLQACVDIVPADHTSYGDPPDGQLDFDGDGQPDPPDLDLNGDGQPDPPDLDFDGDGEPDLIDDPAFEGTVLPGAAVGLSFAPGDRLIDFEPIGYFGTPFDPDANQEEKEALAQELAKGLVDNQVPVTDWVRFLEARSLEIDAGFTPLVEEQVEPESLPEARLSPETLPEDSDYLVSYAFEPTLCYGCADGWRYEGKSASSSISVCGSCGSVSGTLYAGTSPKDYWTPYSSNPGSWTRFLVELVGQQNSGSYYDFYGSGWYKDY